MFVFRHFLSAFGISIFVIFLPYQGLTKTGMLLRVEKTEYQLVGEEKRQRLTYPVSVSVPQQLVTYMLEVCLSSLVFFKFLTKW